MYESNNGADMTVVVFTLENKKKVDMKSLSGNYYSVKVCAV